MEEAQKTINEVVEGVKSEGLFDQFRKECLEEFENMETYHQLKQRVQNHVTSFLSKHRYHDGLQKNTLRSNLRNYISKSDVLLNSIQQLVDEVLSLKGKSFCLRIDKQVDKHLSRNEPAPPLQPSAIDNSQNTGESSHSNNNNNNSDNNYSNYNNNVIVEGQKEILSNGTITEFTEMEIEEVEMEISENQEVDEVFGSERNRNRLLNDGVAVECTGTPENAVLDTVAKTGDVNDFVEQAITTNVVCETEMKIDPENTFQPIEIKTEDGGIDIIVKNESGDETSSEFEGFESEENDDDDDDNGDGDGHSSLSLPPIITEPISDDSNSNDSTFADNVRAKMNEYRTSQDELPVIKDESNCRRKSSRVRTIPLKFRDLEDLKRTDDADSLSSNEIDYKDLEDGMYLTGKRGRARKRPQSAGNPETAKSRKERSSSVSREGVDNAGKKCSSSISKQEEEAINFLTKPSVRKAMKIEEPNSPRDEDGIISDNSRYSCSSSSGRRHSESNEDKNHNISGTCSSGSTRKDANRKKYIKSESGERSYSSMDDYDKSGCTKKDKKDRNLSASGKDENRRDRKSSGSGRDDDRKDQKSLVSGKDSDKRDYKLPGSGKDYNRKDRQSSGSGQDDTRRDHKLSGSGKDIDRKDRKSSGSHKDGDRKVCKSPSSRKDDDRADCKSPGSGKDDDRKDRKMGGSGKDNARREHKLSGSGSGYKDDDRKDRRSPSSVKDEDRSSVRAKDVNRELAKKEYLSDSGTGSTSSMKDDLDRKSRMERDDDVTREDRDLYRTTHKKKRPHSPIASPEDTQSKRSRRSIKQRQRYSPP